jgi:cytochrome c-type biogenesis protein CcmH/NrfG
MNDDFSAAEDMFTRASQLDPMNQAAQINLAMTLEELNQLARATDVWRSLLARDDLAPKDREQIERLVALRERGIQNP